MTAASSLQHDSLSFAGYAALFHHADASRDIIRPGAFTRTLGERREQLPLFWQHRPEQRIGTIQLAEEDMRGLRVIAQVDNLHSRAATMLQTHKVNGLSFGFRPRRYHHAPTGRVLEDIDLLEISLVTHPLQHRARVHFVLNPQTPDAVDPIRLASA